LQVAYLILAHKNPAQLARLVRRLNAPGVAFFVHIDLRSPLAGFQEELRLIPNAEIPNANIHWVERVAAKWGRFGLVQATLNCLETSFAHTPGIDRFVLISGQDYPLRSATDIVRFWQAAPLTTFMEYFSLPTEQWHKGGLDRVETLGLSFPGGHLVRHLIRIFYRRRLPLGLKPFAGSQWWSMSRSHAERVMEFVRRHPGYVRFHHWSLVPDEMFFQIILLNAGDEIKKHIVGDHLRYVVWESPRTYHPNVLGTVDLEAIMASNQLFARKFDTAIDAEILDPIDTRVDAAAPSSAEPK
jgi:hypothetical protein